MDNRLVKRSSDCTILIVDDEIVVCDVLKASLQSHYKVTTALSVKDAFLLIEKNDYDVVVTDLMLPDGSGLDILKNVKSKDDYTEVIMITGYASLDSATSAINLGVSSYLTKPFSITDFLVQVERSIASRIFHLKSISLMQHSDYMEPAVKDHLTDLTSLYYFTRKLMLSLEVSEIMRITLEEVNNRAGAVCSAICVTLLGYNDIFMMPTSGEIAEEDLRSLLLKNWEPFASVSQEKFIKREIPFYFYKGKQGPALNTKDLKVVWVPMMITGRTIGTLAVFLDDDNRTNDPSQFLYVFTSITASIIEHAYLDMQAQHQAKTDSLTGIANHRLFHETLDREIARANRRKGIFALIVIDIDFFKKINDTYGHQVGDAVLIDLTKRIKNTIRGGDVFARYGGEEFGLILPDTDINGADILAQRICKDLANHTCVYSQVEITYTASLGVAIFNGETPMKKDELIAVADKALYDSKHGGRNRVTLSQ